MAVVTRRILISEKLNSSGNACNTYVGGIQVRHCVLFEVFHIPEDMP
jgi:hypothetical protein